VDIDAFITKYRPEWARLETASARGSRGLAGLPGPEIAEIVRLYLRASTHLAEIRTTYADPRLESYLNAVVGRAHAALYGSRSRSIRNVGRFFGERYRAAARRTLPFILVSAGLMAAVTLAMALWVTASPEAQAGVLPGFARDAIRQAGETTSEPDIGIAPSALSTIILTNNVQVALLAFAFGIGFGIGTMYLLVQNAALIGALAGGYQAAGEGARFWALVLPHGLLELTAICIAAGAGLRMGWSLIAPGDRPRGEALVEEARDSVLVVTGVVPAFVLAALIEGFVTGRSGTAAVEIALGVVVAAAYIAFLLAPRRRATPRTERLTAARAL
jgi:uncharacterized membrane protein SpoIIM required for sporulation